MEQTFQDFLATESAKIGLWGFVINLFLAALLALILRAVYARYGNALSNRKAFGRNFLLVTTTTMLVITIVKSSLALSLGLVGALSIVRFRTAIKEPEELSYVFLAIGIGLGLGAGQTVITFLAFSIIIGMIWLTKLSYTEHLDENLYLTITSHNPKKAELQDIVQVLERYCAVVRLKRFDETKELLEASFLVELGNFSQLEAARSDLQNLGEAVKVSFLDNQGLAGV